MGKYTNLARQVEEPRPQKKGVVPNLDNTYKHSILLDTTNNTTSPVAPSSANATPLRGYAVNAVVQCIHRMASEECAVCSGYVRWLIADENRLRRVQRDPEGVHREFWRSVRGEA